MSEKLSATIAATASRQFGLITRLQLTRLGLSAQAIDYRIGAGLFEVFHPAVYRVPGAPSSWGQSLLAALLATGEGSAISHIAAAAEWELEAIEADRPHILVPHERRLFLRGVSIHRTRVIGAGDIRRRRGIRLTSPARTLLDIAGMVAADVLEGAVDDALRRRICTLLHVRRCLDDRGPNGVRGWAILDRFVRERIGTNPTGSGKETTFRRGLINRRLPLPVAQYAVLDARGRFVARPDFAYPDIKLAIEVDGSHHRDPRQWRADLARQNRLTVAGWHFLRFPRTDRAGQREAFDTIEAALSAFGEPDPSSARVGLPKRQAT